MKKRFWLLSLCLVLPLLAGKGALVHAADNPKTSSVTLQWEEFRNLLKLDKDTITLSWEEFQKLLAQTSEKVNPRYTLKGGEVLLTRQEFKQLLAKMIKPNKPDIQPTQDYLLLKGEYLGTVREASTQFRAKLIIHVLGRKKQKFLSIPIFRKELALQDIRLNGKPAAIESSGSWQYLKVDKPGKYQVDAIFSVKGGLKTGGSAGLSFGIPQTPITLIKLTIPKSGLEVYIPKAEQLSFRTVAGKTVAVAHCVPTDWVQISWRKQIAKKDRGPAKVYAEIYNLLSIEADAIRVSAKLKLNILQNSLQSLSLIVPPDYQVLDVSGQAKRAWHVDEVSSQQVLNIVFEFPLEGRHELTIKAEKLLPKETMVADFQGFRVVAAKRESGFIAGEVKSDAEAHVRESHGGDRIDFQKIPPELSGLSSRPILFAFKYVRHPYSITVDITKHERQAALPAVIDLAQVTTLYQEEGKRTHRLIFTTRNLWKQFLKLKLPEGARVWSVYVDNKREKASQDKDGRILIPLARSDQDGSGGLRAFPVELIYTEPAQPFSFLGQQAQQFPESDILINALKWNVYVPSKFAYPRFSGDFQQEKIYAQVPQPCPREEPMLSAPASRGAGAKDDMLMDEILAPEEECSVEYDMEDIAMKEVKQEAPRRKKRMPRKAKMAMLGAASAPPPLPVQAVAAPQKVQMPKQLLGPAGVLSVRVNIPLAGSKYKFSKKIINQDEDLSLRFAYFDERLLHGLFLLLGLGLLYLLYRLRKVIVRLVVAIVKGIWAVVKRLKFMLSPLGLPIVLFLFLVAMQYFDLAYDHPGIFGLSVLGFIAAIIRLFKKPLLKLVRFLWNPQYLAGISLVGLISIFVDSYFWGYLEDLPFLGLFAFLLFVIFLVSGGWVGFKLIKLGWKKYQARKTAKPAEKPKEEKSTKKGQK
jgi:hypothetical protein